jgi:hypothetical protein
VVLRTLRVESVDNYFIYYYQILMCSLSERISGSCYRKSTLSGCDSGAAYGRFLLRDCKFPSVKTATSSGSIGFACKGPYFTAAKEAAAMPPPVASGMTQSYPVDVRHRFQLTRVQTLIAHNRVRRHPNDNPGTTRVTPPIHLDFVTAAFAIIAVAILIIISVVRIII